jgi:hypothetical protein
MDGTRSRHYACYWHKAGPKTREIKGHQRCPLPIIPAELLEWQVFYVELVRQLGLEPDQHYKPLLNGENGRDSKIKEVGRKLSNIEANAKRKEIVLKNLDSLLEQEGLDLPAYSQKRHGYLAEIQALRRKMEETRNELDALRQRKSDEVEFAKFLSEADAFKAVTHKIMNLSFSGKQRLLRGVLDGPIVVGHFIVNPHYDLEKEDAVEEIIEHTTLTVHHNQPLLLELLNEEHTTKSL